MNEVDPSGQLHILSQALANANTNLGFLLGAGCGCSVRTAAGGPLIPAVDQLSAQVCDALRASDVATQLKVLEKQYSEDGEACLPNIEKLLSRIRTLREISGKRKLDGLNAEDLERLDETICRAIEGIVRAKLPTGDTSYSMFARWIRELDRHKPVEIFTTNYDLLLEQALERARAPFFDGFIGAHEPFFDVSAMELDRLPERWTRVWKVHGSVNWRTLTESSIVRSESGPTKPLIFPSHLKYAESRRMPYLAMRDRLRAFVKTRSVFMTCGYSFADEHLNEDLMFGLTANPASV
ncbi:MAG TPA: SIR2 family protein, partial [Thermoanaerobaculia bacterium]|nr:SIR2 family protein [Thermoanaerobaculia bacterium]